mmetsp:Transcript_53503/g.117157  ORF Transcript_53503/g.117157 Transcript_53503/m.117157 type:complete len:82 (-) Transcript_53503:61-306(-)
MNRSAAIAVSHQRRSKSDVLEAASFQFSKLKHTSGKTSYFVSNQNMILMALSAARFFRRAPRAAAGVKEVVPASATVELCV